MIDKSRNHHETNVSLLIKIHSLHIHEGSIDHWLVHVRARRSSLAKWRAVVVGGPLYNISPEPMEEIQSEPIDTRIYYPTTFRLSSTTSTFPTLGITSVFGDIAYLLVGVLISTFVQKLTLSEANLSVCLATKKTLHRLIHSTIHHEFRWSASADWAFGKSSSSIIAPFIFHTL